MRVMKLVIVEDNPAMQRLLLAAVARMPAIQVAGVSGSEPDAITLIERTRPDLLLLDLFLTPGHGLQVLRTIRTAGHTCKVLVLTSEVVHEEYRRIGRELQVIAFHDKGEGLGPLIGDLEKIIAGA